MLTNALAIGPIVVFLHALRKYRFIHFSFVEYLVSEQLVQDFSQEFREMG